MKVKDVMTYDVVSFRTSAPFKEEDVTHVGVV